MNQKIQVIQSNISSFQNVLEANSPSHLNTPIEPSVPYECPAKPTETFDDLSQNPQEYKNKAVLYGCNLNIGSRINSKLHCVAIYSCIFNELQDNSIEGGGAIYIFTSSNKNNSETKLNYIIDCKFTKCHAINGGAISIDTAQNVRFFNITRCIFENNKAETSGGAIYFNAVYATINQCVFVNNEANINGSEIYFHCKEQIS